MRKYHFPFIDLDKEEIWINRYLRLAKYWSCMLLPKLTVFFASIHFRTAFLRETLSALLISGLLVLPYILLNSLFVIVEAVCAVRSYQLYCSKRNRKI